MKLTELFAELKTQLDIDGDTSILRKAIIWGQEDLLGDAIESLLKATNHWQVIKILGNPDVERFAQEVEKVFPTVVIIVQGDCHELHLPLHLIQNFSELKIITVNPVNNRIELYNRKKIWIKEASDLLSIIEEDADSDRREMRPTNNRTDTPNSPVKPAGKL